MANQNYETWRTYDPVIGRRRTLYHIDSSTASPKVNRKVHLRANPFNWDHRRQISYTYSPEFQFRGAPQDTQVQMMSADLRGKVFDQCATKALNKFTKRVRSNSASMGITLATAGQARDMIHDRAKKLASVMDQHTKRFERMKKWERTKYYAEGRGSDYLEWVFGWVPLVQDIEDAFGVLGDDFPIRYISAHSTAIVEGGYVATGSAYAFDTWLKTTFDVNVTVAGFASVSNPNLFLANRLGLLNIPGVLWDIVPWSFVVNMFTNAGQIINSMTDFVGLTLSNCSTTRTGFATRVHTCAAGSAHGQYPTTGRASSTCTEKIKVRTLGTPVPTFYWRAPELNMGLAGIAIALLVQKTKKLNALFQ